MSMDCFVFVEERDEFRMWQGLVGPHYTPAVDSLGNLSWTNNGNLVNPPTVNVSGRGLTITGIVDTAGDLPASAPQYTCYLVGTTSPYHAYIFDGTSWTDLGIVGKGDKGDPGDDGFSPVVTVTTITGGHEVSIEDANGTQTFDVMDGQDGAPGVGVPSGGTDGQMLVKDGSTDYATKWQNQPTIPSAYTGDPEMDGTASPGSSTSWAKGDHVHPTDTSRAASDLGVSGATANQYVQITAVDANGKPTAFGAGTPSGGDVTADMLGIVIDGNSTPVGAAVGQYVIVKNSTITGVTDGLYTAAQAIPANTAIDSTYLSAVSGGGLNGVLSRTQWTLVWQNASAIGSDFAAQTIAIDLSGKTELKIYAAHADGMDPSIPFAWGTYIQIVPIGVQTSISLSVTASNKASFTNYRYVLASATGVTFGSGIECSTTSGASTVANSMQPLKIFAR